MDSKRTSINPTLMRRLGATRRTLRSQEAIKEYNQLYSLDAAKDDPVDLGIIKDITMHGVSITVRVTQLLAALGRFTLIVSLGVKAKTLKGKKVAWSVERMTYNINDAFNFKEDQYLGHWDAKGLSYGFGTTYLNNEVFRDYGKRHDLTGFNLVSENTEDYMTADFIHKFIGK